MKTYMVHLSSQGYLTQLPDSQKLFGILVSMYAEKLNTDNVDWASLFVHKLLNKEIYMTLSNIIPQDYLPMPQDYFQDKIEAAFSKQENLEDKKQIHKNLKKRRYILQNSFKDVVREKGEVYPYMKVQNGQQAHTSLISNQYNIAGLENVLYSVPIINVLKISSKEDEENIKNQTAIKDFIFYIQLDGSEECQNMYSLLESATLDKIIQGMGKKSSQGLNTYQFEDIKQIEINYDNEEMFINMGMLLPDKIDFANSCLKLFISERRPYNPVGGWTKDCEGRFISFIAEGSIITVDKKIENTGKVLESPFNPQRDIVFGKAFLYPL